MKLAIFGGSGLIGSRLVELLRQRGHDALAVSRSSGVDTLTGQGLADVLRGAHALVDVTNSPSFAAADVLRFFQTSTANILRAAAEAGVAHYVALSVVGADRAPDSGYMRAKVAQEALIRAGGLPYTIVRATQFFEFLGAIAESGADGERVCLPSALFQPIAAADVSAALADAATGAPVNAVVELAGPDAVPMDELVRRYLAAVGDPRPVVADADALYFGAHIDDRSLTPGPAPRLGATRFAAWLQQRPVPAA